MYCNATNADGARACHESPRGVARLGTQVENGNPPVSVMNDSSYEYPVEKGAWLERMILSKIQN